MYLERLSLIHLLLGLRNGGDLTESVAVVVIVRVEIVVLCAGTVCLPQT